MRDESEPESKIPAPEEVESSGVNEDGSSDWGLETVELEPETKVAKPERRDPVAYLVCIAGHGVGTMLRIDGEVVIGRAASTDLKLLSEGISREHLRITKSPGGQVKLQDLGSRNGTFVNGERVNETVLKDGDKITVGQTVILKFSYADTIEVEFQRQMYDSAVRDSLTGLHNRRYLMDRLQEEVSFSLRHQTPLAFAMLDLDHFKQINDGYGHTVGDAVLRRLGKLFSQQIRREDVAGRYGGEEFGLVLRGLSEAQGRFAAERLRTSVEAEEFVPEHPDLRVTISGGVAALPCPALGTVEALIEAADRALYEAKAAGRNRVVVHGQD